MKRKANVASATTRIMTMLLPLGQGGWNRTDYASLAKEGYQENCVVYACVKEIAEAAAGVPWQLFRRRPNGERVEVLEHPLLKLLERPNPLQGKFEFIEALLSFLYISGNTYIEAVGPGGSGGSEQTRPRELYVLRPDRMKILPHPVHIVGGYEYSVGGETARLAADRVLHLKLFNPLDDWYGWSPVRVAALAIDKMNSGDKWNAALLQNSAVPSGALVSKQRLTDEQFNRLRSEMREQIQGVSNAREPLLLEQDLEWRELGISPKDMDWTEGLKLSALQIAEAYNIPPELIGLQPATYQNRKEARKALYTEVVLPALYRLRDALNNWIVPRFGDDLVLDYDKGKIEALSEDQESLWRRVNT
ncbi:MAG: phage portal protein, partial [Nitrospinae bacterium]|nr:phage portal protein [Nitrospinota bacterium]